MGENNTIIEQFINDYVYIKESSRLDIATEVNGDIEQGYDTNFTDGTHPNYNGHIKMFNRLRIDILSCLIV